MTTQLRALLAAWFTIDLFGKSRRSGERGTGTLTTAVFTQGFLSWCFAALCFEDVPPVPFLAGTLSLVAGFAALAMLGEVLHDQIGHPADRDLVLASPISRLTLATGRALHTVSMLCLFSLGLAVAPAILIGFKTKSFVVVPLYLASAVVLSALVTAAIQVPVVLSAKLLGRGIGASVSAAIRGGLLGGGFLGLLLGFRAMHQGAHAFPGGIDFLQWTPPYWFARLLLDGSHSPIIVASAAALVGLLVFASSLRQRDRSGRRRRSRWLGRLTRILSRDRATHGLADFTLTMLVRERSFRLRALPLLGLPTAAVILGLRAGVERETLPFFFGLVHNLPLIYLPMLIFFVPYAEGHSASWLVNASLAEPLAMSRKAVGTAFAVALVPLQALLLALDCSQRSVTDATVTTLAALGFAWLAMPVLTERVEEVAFSQDPDDLAPPGSLGAPMTIAAVAMIAALAVEALALPLRATIAVAAFAAGIGLLRGGGTARE
ncbi:MAG: hypothetical protein CMJ85_07335 [Planctomycetes bacterium]|nr:hypothetical protein [Planctomycetota bacterium]